MKRLGASLAALVLTTLGVALAGGARAADEFYDGQTITYIVGTKPGGGYDTYARLIGRYLERHLPGARVLVENVPGAGHIVAANRLFASPPDGLTIGTFNTGLIYAQILDLEGVRFDLRDYDWIGKAASDPRVLVVGAESGIGSLADLAAPGEPKLFGTTGVGSASHNDMAVLATALGLNIKLVPGFSGQEIQLAILRGDIQGLLGSVSSVEEFVANGYGRMLVRLGGDDDPALAAVPEAGTLVADAELRALLGVVRANAGLGRLTAAPPDVPEDRLSILRTAYRATLEDPDLLAEAERLGRPIDPSYGDEVASQIDAALSLPPDLVASLVAAIGCGEDVDCAPGD
jgi:tripartite-type tricarboxylate transporter receptor subunit TctC